AVRFSSPLCGAFPAFPPVGRHGSGWFWGYFSFGFYRGGIVFLADFLFRGLAVGSFAKISVSRRARVFANVPTQGGTKNVTKKLFGRGF
ncbi:MAG: hypothetical protein JXB17_13725, partial [Bacteroidales bacterium]|nr:hypothetical protein [Bacteroidales bacterium]